MPTDDETSNNVRYLHVPAAAPPPAVRADTQPEPTEVLEGELVSDDDYAAIQHRKAMERWHGYGQTATTTVHVVKHVVTHERTKTTSRAVARNVAYVFGGAGIVARRIWEARTGARYERMMRVGEAKGDMTMVENWEARGELARQRRHDRRMDMVNVPKKLAEGLVWAILVTLGVLLLFGLLLALANEDGFTFSQVLDPIRGFLAAVQWIAMFVTVMWGLITTFGLFIAIGVFWWLGQRAGATPKMFESAAVRRMEHHGEPITPSVVIIALREVGITKLRKVIEKMEDGAATMLGPIVPGRCGVEVTVYLPHGVDIADFMSEKRRRILAGNLGRHEHELFITIAPQARAVTLWIADSGALDEPIGPSSLVTDTDMTADLYTGVAPWGESLRGDAVAISLLQRHVLITGLSNQGKTAAARALALWLALDPTLELRIADLKGVGDWRMFSNIATELIQGPTDDHVRQATEMVEEGVREMNRRMAWLEQSGSPDGVTRDMARKDPRFKPLFLIVDEAQVAFMCPAIDPETETPYGGSKNTSRFFMACRYILNQGRAVNVVLHLYTQNPTDQNLPVMVREAMHIRASLVLSKESQSRMALGDAPVDRGAAPHQLRQDLDKGTLVVTGGGVPIPAGQPSITVRTNFISGEDAARIAARAVELRSGARHVTVEARDLLADVFSVLRGEDMVKATDVAARLRELAPDYAPYSKLTAQNLSEELEKIGVPVRHLDGLRTVRAAVVRAALEIRDGSDRSDQGE